MFSIAAYPMYNCVGFVVISEAHDALYNFSCTILSARQCTDFTNEDTSSTIQQ